MGGMNNLALILDGTAVAYRAFHAVQDLSAPDGTPTNALFGFVRLLKQMEKHWQPAKTIVVFDGGSPPSRMNLCPHYKAQRAPMPDALRVQFELIEEFLDASGTPHLRLPNEEADDVIATLAVRASESGCSVRIATSDKDLMQLVTPSIWLVAPTKDAKVLDPPGVKEKTGVKPEQIVEWLALIGDSADNLPGVSGIGPKTATKLLEEYGSLAGIWAALDSLPSDKMRERLREGRHVAEINVQMMTLDLAVQGVPAWQEIPPPAPPDHDHLQTFYASYGLHRFAAEDAAPPPAVAGDADRIREEEDLLADLARERARGGATPPAAKGKSAAGKNNPDQLSLF